MTWTIDIVGAHSDTGIAIPVSWCIGMEQVLQYWGWNKEIAKPCIGWNATMPVRYTCTGILEYGHTGTYMTDRLSVPVPVHVCRYRYRCPGRGHTGREHTALLGLALSRHALPTIVE